MATVTVKNIPDELYERLKQVASTNRRSINSEIIVCIERAVQSRRLSDEAMLEETRKLRAQITRAYLTDELLEEAKQEGRP